MADNRFLREEMLIGSECLKKLNNSSVIVFGIGGVGSYIAEALARAGIGKITLVDDDTVSLTNINRQLIALDSTVGMKKVDVMKSRILDINPDADVTAVDAFLSAETFEQFKLEQYDYVADAIDTVTSKILLAVECEQRGIPIISSMGTGNKFDPTGFRVSDIYKTSGCPLARVMRRELKKRGVKSLTVVYSPEEPRKTMFQPDEAEQRKIIPGTVSFVPPAAGLAIAGKIITDLIQKCCDEDE